MGGAGEDQVGQAELLEVAEALELRRVDEGDREIRQLEQTCEKENRGRRRAAAGRALGVELGTALRSSPWTGSMNAFPWPNNLSLKPTISAVCCVSCWWYSSSPSSGLRGS